MVRKLKNNRGETVIEVLASVLIAALSVALLFGAVSASARIDMSARKMDGEYYGALSAAEAQESPMPEKPGGTADVKYWENGVEKSLPPLAVVFYGGRGAVSYALPPEGGGGGP